jgi:hypothetical protein
VLAQWQNFNCGASRNARKILIIVIIIIIIIIIGIEIKRIWNLICTIIPVIIGATGIVTRSLRKHLETVPGKHSIDSVQKTAVLGTSHTIRKVLQC